MVKRNNGRREFIPDINIENARITGRSNFSGSEKTYNGRIVNSEGNRNFCIDIPEDGVMLADTGEWVDVNWLIQKGWPVKIHAGGDGENPSYYMPIKVNFGFRPPTMYLVTGPRRTVLDETMVGDLDGRNFTKVDLVVHPSVFQDWDTGDVQVRAYLAEGWFYVNMSPFEEAWSNAHPDDEDYA